MRHAAVGSIILLGIIWSKLNGSVDVNIVDEEANRNDV